MKPRGRPRLAADEEESVKFSVRLSPKQFDQTQRDATAARMTMAEWVRRVLGRGFVSDKNRR